MKFKISKIAYLIFIIFILEILGFILMEFHSRRFDFVDNKKYNQIREMLMADNNQQIVSKYIQTPYLTYIPNPGYKKNGVIQHNNAGYRGEMVPLKKGNKYRVLCLGGSTTYGTGVEDPKDAYPAQLNLILQKSGKFPQGIEVINAGLEAGTSAEELTHYLFKFKYYQPDLVIIHSGGNDAMVLERDGNYQFDYSHYRKTRFNEEPISNRIKWALHSRFISFWVIFLFYDQTYNSTVDPFTNIGVRSLKQARWSDTTLLSNIEYHPFYQNHKTLLENITKDGSKIININFGYNEEFAELQNMNDYQKNITFYNGIIQKLSEELRITYVPFQYSSISNKSYWLDDCHLNKKGEQEKALMISSYILQNQSQP